MSADLDARFARGRAWYVILEQRELWHRDRTPIRLEEMDDTHRRNLLAWIDRHATKIVRLAWWGAVDYWSTELGRPHGDWAYDALERTSEAETDQMNEDPVGWLHDTPFYRRLAELVAADGTPPPFPKRPRLRLRPRPLEV